MDECSEQPCWRESWRFAGDRGVIKCSKLPLQSLSQLVPDRSNNANSDCEEQETDRTSGGRKKTLKLKRRGQIKNSHHPGFASVLNVFTLYRGPHCILNALITISTCVCVCHTIAAACLFFPPHLSRSIFTFCARFWCCFCCGLHRRLSRRRSPPDRCVIICVVVTHRTMSPILPARARDKKTTPTVTVEPVLAEILWKFCTIYYATEW